MSELKPYKMVDEEYCTDCVCVIPSEVYLKSEADKVIAEKDVEIAELKAQKAQAEDDCAYWKMSEGNAANAMHETEEYAMQLYNELRHQKYKRCLAMWLYLRECYWRCKHHNEQTRANWYNKWMDVFQKLAEKFKEGK